MFNQVRRFEIAVLRPVQLLLLGAAVVMVSRSQWWWLAGCVLGIFYLGIVGSKLHPLQSASDLTKGPLESSEALAESAILSPGDKRWLVGQACTSVAILMGLALFVVLLGALDWRWYWAVLTAWVAMILVVVVLKVVFKSV